MSVRDRLGRILRVRLFTKILVANAVLVSLAALAGALAGAELAQGSEGNALAVAVPVVLAGIALTVIVDAVILQLALEPLHQLQRIALRVREGDLSARAPESSFADPDLARLGEAFNDAVERVALYRRKLGDAAARTMRREEADHDRVARALHEDAAQRLAALLLRLRVAAGESRAPLQLERLLADTRQEIAAALGVIRDYAAARSPRALEELGLAAAVAARARDLRERGLEVAIECRGWDEAREPERELDLYRIVAEALDNVAEHAQARRAVVRLSRTGSAVEVSVEDDGRGFDVQTALGGEALGLFEMRERAAAAGGTLDIESRPGVGTSVRATVPGPGDGARPTR